MSNQEVHQDVFAVWKGLNGSSQTDGEVFYEELCIFSVYEGGISGDHAVVVRQFRTEHPQPLFLIPVMSSGRKSDNSVLKCLCVSIPNSVISIILPNVRVLKTV